MSLDCKKHAIDISEIFPILTTTLSDHQRQLKDMMECKFGFRRPWPFTLMDLQSASKTSLLWEASSTFLIIKIKLPHWRCLLVTARAPHSGHGSHQVEQFWTTISTKIRQLSRTWPVIFVGDTNGHLGEQVTPAVGHHHPSKENTSGTAFHQWLLEQQLFVPATFPQYCAGETVHTYVLP